MATDAITRRELAVQTDTELAYLHGEKAQVARGLPSAASQIRRLAGQREVNGKWNGTFADAEAIVRELHDGAEYACTKGAGLLRQLAAIRADGAEIEERIAILAAVYDEHRWNRYFLVTN